MNSESAGRTARTRGANDRLLRASERLDHRPVDPQALLTQEALRRYIEACICPFCGAGPFKLLPMHTNQAHGIDKRELRARAGLTSNEPISSAEFRSAQRANAIEADLGHSHFAEMGRRRAKRGSDLTEAGRAKISANARAINDRLTPEERSERMRQIAIAVSPEARKRQGESLKRYHAENPAPAERLEKMQAGLRTPEARAKQAAAAASRRLGHGTVAEYSHHGCRCDPCKAAKKASRPGPGIRRGEAHGKSKITDAQVAELRKLAADGVKQRTLAEMFGIGEGTVSLIVRNKSRVSPN